MFLSIKSKIIAVLLVIMFATALTVSLIAHTTISGSMDAEQDGFARNILKLVMHDVSSKYDSLLRFELDEIGRRRLMLESDARAVTAILRTCSDLAMEGHVDEDEAKALALERIAQLSGPFSSELFLFDHDLVGVWHPDGRMVGRIWNSYLNIKGKDALAHSLKRLKDEEHDYSVVYWSKNMDTPLSKHMAYFTLFDTWGWVVGTAQPLEGIEQDVTRMQERMVHDIGQTLKGIRVANNGYVFLFNGSREILIHPVLETHGGMELFSRDMERVMETLMDVDGGESLPISFASQVWDPDSPWSRTEPEPHLGYVDYFRAMDWYVAYVLPEADLLSPARVLTRQVTTLVAAIFLVSAAFVWLVVFRYLKPFAVVTRYVEGLHIEAGDASAPGEAAEEEGGERQGPDEGLVRTLADSSRDEAGRLAGAFVAMEERLQRSIDWLRTTSREKEEVARQLEEANRELDHRVGLRTEELERANRKLTMEVAERKRSSREVRNLNTFLDTIIENASVWVSVSEEDGTVILWNKAAVSMSGYRAEEVKGKRHIWGLLFGDEDRYSRIMTGRSVWAVNEEAMARTVAMICKDRSIKHVSLFSRRLVMADGEAHHLVVGVDVTERIHAESARRESELRYRGMFEHMADGVFVLARMAGKSDFLIKDMNPAAEEMERVRQVDVLGKPMGEELPALRVPGLRETALMVWETGRSRRLETRFHRPSTEGGELEWRENFLYRLPQGEVVVIVEDVTQRKRMQAETIRASHLASIGELAAGVAHEINNPINGIINYAQILADTGSMTTDGLNLPERIIAEGERIAGIVRNLLHFAHKGGRDKVVFDLRGVLDRTLELVGVQLEKDSIALSVEGVEEGLPVLGRPQEIQQVLLNLVSNSRHALNERHGATAGSKRLDIELSRLREGGREIVRTVMLDNGSGIPAEHLGRVFDPFHTTKPVGEGTGLGLSISYGIIRDHGGDLTIASRRGEFTRVVMDLPVSAEV